MKRVVLYVALLSLVGCAPTRYKPLCPPVVHYTAQEEKQAADELHAHPELKELPVMMRDYGNERQEICNVSLPKNKKPVIMKNFYYNRFILSTPQCTLQDHKNK